MRHRSFLRQFLRLAWAIVLLIPYTILLSSVSCLNGSHLAGRISCSNQMLKKKKEYTHHIYIYIYIYIYCDKKDSNVIF